MAVIGLPKLPEVIFWSSDRCYLVRDVPVMKWGQRYIRLFLIPEEEVKWRYAIKDKDLNFEISEYGVLVREVPYEYFRRLGSRNPENTIYIVFANFDGTEIIDNEIAMMATEIARKDALASALRSENETLREQYKIAVEQLRALESKRLERA